MELTVVPTTADVEVAPERGLRVDAQPAFSTTSRGTSADADIEHAQAVFDAMLERGPRPSWRIGLGAALILTVVAAAIAVLVIALSPAATTVVAPPGATKAGMEQAGTAERTGGGKGRSTPAGGAGDAVAGGANSPAGSTGSTGSTAVKQVKVHVLGAVVHPGVYDLPANSRVMDAMDRAGGAAPTANLAGLNLARIVTDGEQIRVPAEGEPVPPAGQQAGGAGGGTAGTGGSTAAGSTGATGKSPGQLINLNTATVAELDTLPRIGPALAQRIIDARDAQGGFTSVDDLRRVPGIGDATFAQLKPLVTV